jgi:hypothetical protein
LSTPKKQKNKIFFSCTKEPYMVELNHEDKARRKDGDHNAVSSEGYSRRDHQAGKRTGPICKRTAAENYYETTGDKPQVAPYGIKGQELI